MVILKTAEASYLAMTSKKKRHSSAAKQQTTRKMMMIELGCTSINYFNYPSLSNRSEGVNQCRNNKSSVPLFEVEER